MIVDGSGIAKFSSRIELSSLENCVREKWKKEFGGIEERWFLRLCLKKETLN